MGTRTKLMKINRLSNFWVVALLMIVATILESQAQAREAVYLLPDKPWSSVSKATRALNSSSFLTLPTTQIPEITLEEPKIKKPLKRSARRIPSEMESGAGFVRAHPMAISGRTSQPSLPFELSREKIERRYSLPTISPVDSLRVSTEEIQ